MTIEVVLNPIGSSVVPSVRALSLYTALNIQIPFAEWMRECIPNLSLDALVDYQTLHMDGAIGVLDYILSTEAAYAICTRIGSAEALAIRHRMTLDIRQHFRVRDRR